MFNFGIEQNERRAYFCRINSLIFKLTTYDNIMIMHIRTVFFPQNGEIFFRYLSFFLVFLLLFFFYQIINFSWALGVSWNFFFCIRFVYFTSLIKLTLPTLIKPLIIDFCIISIHKKIISIRFWNFIFYYFVFFWVIQFVALFSLNRVRNMSTYSQCVNCRTSLRFYTYYQ